MLSSLRFDQNHPSVYQSSSQFDHSHHPIYQSPYNSIRIILSHRYNSIRILTIRSSNPVHQSFLRLVRIIRVDLKIFVHVSGIAKMLLDEQQKHAAYG
jgi:hypothetical protein